MYDELTKVDIKKMQDELDYRIGVLRPKILEEVKHDPTLYEGRYSCDEETAWQRYNLDIVRHAVPNKTKGIIQ